MFSFLANFAASKQEMQKSIEMLMEAYPEDVDLKVTNKSLYLKQS